MALHLVTGYAGYEHITSDDQGSFNASFFGSGQFVMEAGNQFEASIIDNNTVRVLDGDILMKGRHIRLKKNTYEDLTIETGTAGVNRCDLIVVEYRKDETTGIETSEFKVLKGAETTGAAVAPSYIGGDILGGAAFNQMPLYKVYVEGVVLVDIEALFESIPTYATLAERYRQQFIRDCQTHLNSLGVLDTMEEVEANTQENQLAGALALKEHERVIKNDLNAQLDPTFFRFKLIQDLSYPMAGMIDYIKNNFSDFKKGITILYFQPNGSYENAIISKTNDLYGSVLTFGYDNQLKQYQLYNGIWSIQ